MPSGKSLYIGLNAVDPKQYSGWSGELSGCEFDAKDMRAIAKKHGFATTLRLTKSATRNKILGDLKRAAKTLRRNDIFSSVIRGTAVRCRTPATILSQMARRNLVSLR